MYYICTQTTRYEFLHIAIHILQAIRQRAYLHFANGSGCISSFSSAIRSIRAVANPSLTREMTIVSPTKRRVVVLSAVLALSSQSSGGGGREGQPAASLETYQNFMSSPLKLMEGNVVDRSDFPLTSPFPDIAFYRMDEQDDAVFYSHPRIYVHHIDDACIGRLSGWYGQFIQTRYPNSEVHVDLASSWVSHFPDFYRPKRQAHFWGFLGILLLLFKEVLCTLFQREYTQKLASLLGQIHRGWYEQARVGSKS